MKKFFVLTAAAFALNALTAQADTTRFLDDSASFTIARAVKLGDSDGDYGIAPTVVSAKKKTNLKKIECMSSSDCSSSQKCVGGKCVSVCTDGTCSGETPDCSGENHKAVCSCTENSCGSGKKCSDGQCVSCSVGDKCGCSGEQVIVSGGKCGCPASTTCPAGQYKTDDCSCRNCQKDNTYDRCGCAAPLVPNGSGSCYCKETTCAAGNSFSSSACGCVPCTDNASCQYPCSNGQIPNGKGGCYTDTKTCESQGYTSDSSKSSQPNFVVTTINGTKCYTLGSSSGGSSSSSSSSCEKCGPSSAGTYRAGSRVCFLGNSISRNAWISSGGCCSHVYCQTVPTGIYCKVDSNGILVGGVCPSE